MDYKRADDQLFGKYCYIDTPWIAGKHTIYRIIRSGVRSNSWCEVPVNGWTKKVNHGEHSEEIVFVVLDTLLDENTEIMRFALKDVEIIETADRKTENSSEKPNNCEECKHWNDTEDGCADRHGCRATTEDWQDWKDKMWSEAVVTEPQTCSVLGRAIDEIVEERIERWKRSE